MKKLLIFLFLFELTTPAFAQSVGINNTGASPHSSAILDIQSTDKGLLIPRMTQAQRYAITAPATGLMVYQTDQEKGFYYNYSTPLFPLWKKVGADALPKGMIIMSDSFPNSTLESNGFSPVGALQNMTMATYGNNGRWTPVNTNNMLTATGWAYAVWTGTEVIYWERNEAKRYNPSIDTWTTIPNNPLLDQRTSPAVIWTGTELFIWGGEDGTLNYVNTGARYNPSTNTWQAMSTANAPIGRSGAAAYWTGTEIIFFGGHRSFDVSDGAKYNPATNTWTPMATLNGPGNRIGYATAWTGDKLLVWGGKMNDNSVNTGSIYTPATNTWTAMPTQNAPSVRNSALSAWSGTEFLIWGGLSENFNSGCQCFARFDGAKFNLTTMSWSAISSINSPNLETYTSAFAGGRWFLFNQGGKSYDPVANNWSDVPNPGVQPAAYGPFVVKAMNDMVFVWGSSANYQQTLATTHRVGGVWDPASNAWVKMISEDGSPLRSFSTPVWTGTEMIVSTIPRDGDPIGAVRTSRYNPSQEGFGASVSKTLYLYKKN